MTGDLPDKVRVDFADITFAELGDALDAAGVADLAKATGGQQARANAAFAWVVLRRDHPDVTLDDVLRMPVSAVEVVGADAMGKPSAPSDGAPLLGSDALGGSDPSTS